MCAFLTRSLHELLLSAADADDQAADYPPTMSKLNRRDFIPDEDACGDDANEWTDEDDHDDDDDDDDEKKSSEFVSDVLEPLGKLTVSPATDVYIVLDGIDDVQASDPCTAVRLVVFLARALAHFPAWLHLIMSARRSTEKRLLRKHFQTPLPTPTTTKNSTETVAPAPYDKMFIDKYLNYRAARSASKEQRSRVQRSNSTSNSSTGNASRQAKSAMQLSKSMHSHMTAAATAADLFDDSKHRSGSTVSNQNHDLNFKNSSLVSFYHYNLN